MRGLNEQLRDLCAGYGSIVEFGAGRFERLNMLYAERRIGIEICEPMFMDYAPSQATGVLGDFREYRSLLDVAELPAPRLALFCDSLEHIPKTDGFHLLRKCQSDFDTVVVFAPIGEDPQEEDEWGYGNEWQRHRASWFECDLVSFGFEIIQREDYDDRSSSMFAVWRRDDT